MKNSKLLLEVPQLQAHLAPDGAISAWHRIESAIWAGLDLQDSQKKAVEHMRAEYDREGLTPPVVVLVDDESEDGMNVDWDFRFVFQDVPYYLRLKVGEWQGSDPGTFLEHVSLMNVTEGEEDYALFSFDNPAEGARFFFSEVWQTVSFVEMPRIEAFLNHFLSNPTLLGQVTNLEIEVILLGLKNFNAIFAPK